MPGGSAPRWGDTCPTPPGATEDGCLVTGRLSRLTIDANGVATGAEQVLLTGWCQQYPSHSVGTVTFGPDGALYVGGGDGASFNFADWGQVKNPCARPAEPGRDEPVAADRARAARCARSPCAAPAGEPVTLNGTILRVNPDTGAAMPGNPFAASPDANAQPDRSRTACATSSGSASGPAPASCGSATSAGTRGRRSTGSRTRPTRWRRTSAGPATRAPRGSPATTART